MYFCLKCVAFLEDLVYAGKIKTTATLFGVGAGAWGEGLALLIGPS